MKNFSVAIDVKAPRDAIVAALFDVERWPEWTPTVTSARRLDEGPFTVGSKARIEQPKLLPAVWRVIELDAERGFAWVTQNRGLEMKAEHWVDAGVAGSRVSLSFQFSGLLGSLAGWLYGGLSERYMATEAEGLRKRCEG